MNMFLLNLLCKFAKNIQTNLIVKQRSAHEPMSENSPEMRNRFQGKTLVVCKRNFKYLPLLLEIKSRQGHKYVWIYKLIH